MMLKRLVGDFIRKCNPLEVEQIIIPIDNISTNFTSLKIAHVSDVHIPRSAFSPHEISEILKKQAPDVIFLTGDMMDVASKFEAPKIALLTSLLMEIAPLYVISGNHERRKRGYEQIWETMLKLRGAYVMNDQVRRFEKEGVTFVVTGMRDINVNKILESDVSFLTEIEVATTECHLLLHHKPNIWRSYYPDDAPTPNVVFSGHAHGGQARIPFIKRGLIAPDQGLFPKYTSGLYAYSDGSVEVVSRGIASSTRPVRIGNKPHIPIVVLVSKG